MITCGASLDHPDCWHTRPSNLVAEKPHRWTSWALILVELGNAAKIKFADWPNVAVRFTMLIKWRVGLTLGPGRSLMHGVAPQMCGRVANPLLDLGAGGRSPGYLMPPRLVAPA